MNENAKKWVEDLRTTLDQQGKNHLHNKNKNNESFCCLGRACIIFNLNNIEKNLIIKEDELFGFMTYNGEGYILPEVVRIWLGLKSSVGSYRNGNNCLAKENDNGKTFLEIANIIEANEKELFINE